MPKTLSINFRQSEIDIDKTKLECLEIGESFTTRWINASAMRYHAIKLKYDVKCKKISALVIRVTRIEAPAGRAHG